MASSLPLSGSAESSAVVRAVSWLEATLLGPLAASVAVIAIASVGFMMLSGRVEIRRGATVVVGSFILFGATAIAAALQSLTSPEPRPTAALSHSTFEPPPYAAPPDAPEAYDPYAGASVTPR